MSKYVVKLIVVYFLISQSLTLLGQQAKATPMAIDTTKTTPIQLDPSYDRELKQLIDQWYAGHTQRATAKHQNSPKDGNKVIEHLSDSLCIELLNQLPSAFPMSFNPDVRQAIDIYVEKRKPLLSMMLRAGDIYFPEMEISLDRHGLPLELKYLAIVESALNPRAVSPVGASGLWQLMLPTGRTYGLQINSLVDERFDFIKSTDAACRLLKDLYRMYGDWLLAIAAYNSGPRNVNNAIRKAGGTSDFWQVYYYLPRETRRYIPLFIAAYFSMYYHDRFGIEPLEVGLPVATDYYTVSDAITFDDLAALSGVDRKMIEVFNPQYRRGIVPGNMGEGCDVRLPLEGILKLDALPVEQIKSNKLAVQIQDTKAAYGDYGKDKGGRGKAKVRYHRVRKGETLSSIAKRYGTTSKALKRLNKLKKNTLKVGQRLIVGR